MADLREHIEVARLGQVREHLIADFGLDLWRWPCHLLGQAPLPNGEAFEDIGLVIALVAICATSQL